MPCHCRHGRFVLLFYQLAHPPVILSLVVTHTYAFRPTRNGELVSERTPTRRQRRSVETQDDQIGLPPFTSFQTYAFRSCEHVTIWLWTGDQSTDETSWSCSRSSCNKFRCLRECSGSPCRLTQYSCLRRWQPGYNHYSTHATRSCRPHDSPSLLPCCHPRPQIMTYESGNNKKNYLGSWCTLHTSHSLFVVNMIITQ